jgi:hypothetical protein
MCRQVVKDIGGVQFEQARQETGGEKSIGAPGRQRMDPPHPDPAARAAADVKRLLAQATHLRLLVEVAETVAGGEDLSASERAPERPADDQDPAERDDQTDQT